VRFRSGIKRKAYKRRDTSRRLRMFDLMLRVGYLRESVAVVCCEPKGVSAQVYYKRMFIVSLPMNILCS
jgi:hypothetical protein